MGHHTTTLPPHGYHSRMKCCSKYYNNNNSLTIVLQHNLGEPTTNPHYRHCSIGGRHVPILNGQGTSVPSYMRAESVRVNNETLFEGHMRCEKPRMLTRSLFVAADFVFICDEEDLVRGQT